MHSFEGVQGIVGIKFLFPECRSSPRRPVRFLTARGTFEVVNIYDFND
jgi:hypothetical protein